jgi:nucleoside 2-deoxyribosyltransferase
LRKLIVYLAGDIAPENWRQRVLDKFKNREGIDFFYPRTGLSYKERSLAQTEKSRTAYHIADLLKIESSDIVFAYIEKDSPSAYSGTSCEIGYAKARGKYIILVKEETSHLYNFIKRVADIVFEKLDDGIEHLMDILEEMEVKEVK